MKKILGMIAICACAMAMIGCSAKEEPATDTTSGTTGTTAQTPEKPADDATPKTTATVVDYTKDGKLWCTVMDHEIESKEKADSYQDYEGKRYYFCCGACPAKFKEDPKKYAMK